MHPPNATLHRHDQFHSAFLPGNRDVLVWLPPGHDDDTDRRYPVLYMHDGQNLFDAATGFSGEWQVDETLAILATEGWAGRLPDALRFLFGRP